MTIDYTNTGDVLSQIRARQSNQTTAPARFPLGKIAATPAVLELLERTSYSASALLARHSACDFGDLDAHDHKQNEDAIKNGGRIFSVYRLCDAAWLKQIPRSQRHTIETVWIITNGTNDVGVRDGTVLMTPACY